jgi:hypothetical protein
VNFFPNLYRKSLIATGLAVATAIIPGALCLADSKTSPQEIETESLAAGACIGRGAGLIGGYVKFRPFDFLGIEASLGKRLFVFDDFEDIEFYWPTMGAARVEFFFMDRVQRLQAGISSGLLAAQDMGLGVDLAGIVTWRIHRHIHLDGLLGIAIFPQIKSRQINYLINKKRGRTESFYEHSATFVDISPIIPMWGMGIAWVF